MTENWYLVLELEFDPKPVEDESVIKNRIQEKSKFWSSKANDFNKGAEYRKYLDYAKKGIIEREMLGESNIRAELIKDAIDKTYGPIDKIIKQMKKEEIPSDAVDKMAKKLKVDPDVIKKRIAALGKKIGSSQSGDFEAVYEKHYKSKPPKTDLYNGTVPMLESFHVKDLYEFLFQNTSIKSAQKLPCDALRQRAGERKKKEFFKSDAVSGTGAKLCGLCEQAFKDESSKAIYDEYLKYVRRKEILDDAKGMYEVSGELTVEQTTDYKRRLTEVSADSNLSEKVFTAFCKVEKIPLPVSGSGTADNPRIKVCRCGCGNDISDGRTKCSACGLNLQIKCPKCGELNDNNINVCKCGFKFENIDKAISLCELAGLAIDLLEFDVAEAHLTDAGRYWPGSDEVEKLKIKLSDMKKRIGTAAQQLRSACDEQKYYEANRQYINIKKFFPDFSDSELEERISSAIAQAEEHKKKAESSKDEETIVYECTKAFEACKDYPGIREIISRFPPSAPTGLKVVADANAKVNVLSWNASSTQGLLFYCVIRKAGAIPISVQDGTMIGRVSMCSITDTSIVPGVEYYYAIFAERAEIFSKALSTPEAVSNFFEISGLNVAAGDSTLQFTWNAPADNAVVMIERTGGGSDYSIECKNRSNYLDKDLINDQQYTYHFYLTYTVGIKKFNTKGIKIYGIPTKPPLPIEKLTVKPLENGEFQIDWDNPENGDVQFYCSTIKPKYIFGDLISISVIQSEMTELMIKKVTNSSGTFKHDSEDLIYIVSVVVKSGSGIIGAIARASKGGAVKVKDATLVNGKILISVDEPTDCSGYVVLYRPDHFPDDISDIKSTRKYISLKQYHYDSGLLIDSNESKDYYFSIFAEFKRDGEKDYSVGTDFLFSNVSKKIITYSVKVVKKFIGSASLDITFECDDKEFTLPGIDLMSAVGLAPMFKKQATLFYSIPSQKAVGPVTIHIPFPKGLAKDTYIRAFLNDDSLQSKYQLKLKVKSDLKIS